MCRVTSPPLSVATLCLKSCQAHCEKKKRTLPSYLSCRFCGQDLKKRAKDFCTAVTEALLCSSNLDSHSDPIPPELLTGPTLVATEVGPGRGKAPSKGVNVPGGLGSPKECISCRAELKKKGRGREGLEEGHAADLERVCQACYKVGTETGKLECTPRLKLTQN